MIRPVRTDILRIILVTLLLATGSGCAGVSPFRKQAERTAPPPHPAALPAERAAGSLPTVTLPVATASPPLRRARPSRFSEPAARSYRSGVMTEDTVWHGQIIVEGPLTVAPQATLAISPGTVVRFRPSPAGEAGLLLVRGRIQAAGTREEPVTFTSDETGPAAGDWQGIILLDSAKKNLLHWCRIEAAAAGIAAHFSDLVLREITVSRCRTGVTLRSSTAVISGGGVTTCGTGLIATDGDLDLTGGLFTANDRGIVVQDGSLFLRETEVSGSAGEGIMVTGTRLRIEGCRVERNAAGATFTRCRGDLVGSSVAGNRAAGLDLVDAPLLVTRNRITGNGGAGVTVRSGWATIWENLIEGNGEGGLVVSGTAEAVAPANWWGSADPAEVRGRIRGGDGGRVLYLPILTSPP